MQVHVLRLLVALILIDSQQYGDFNEDGERNAADFAILSEAIFEPTDNLRLSSRMDMNADGRIDQHDATLWSSL